MAIEAALISAASSLTTKLIGHLLSKEQKSLEQETKARKEQSESLKEADALARAIGIEIAALVQAVIGRYTWWRKLKKEEKLKWLPPLVPFYVDAYTQLKNRIEKLPPDIVGASVRFYGYVQFLNGLQDTRKEYQERGQQAAFDSIYQGSLETLIIIGATSVNVIKRHVPELKDEEDIPIPKR